MRLSKYIICLSLRLGHWQIMILCNNRVQKLFYHLITKFVFNKYLWEVKQSTLSHKSDRKEEKSVVSFTRAEYYLQPNTIGWHCARADHHLKADICRSRGGLSANEKKEKFASNNKISYSGIHCTTHVYATTTICSRITSCLGLQGQADLTLDKHM